MPSTSQPVPLLRRHWSLALVLCGALALRLWGLNDWWLNPDEGIYYSMITRGDLSGFWAEVMGNAHPPLYYLMLRALGLFTWNFTWFRALSVVFGLTAIIGVWAVARELWGRGTAGAVSGFVAATVLALSPGAILLSQVIRPYMFHLTLLTAALWCLLRYLRTPSRHHLAWYVALVVLALLTHYSTLLALGVFGLVVGYDGVSRGFGRPEWKRLAAWHVAPIVVVGLLYFLHLRRLAGGPLADEALDGWLSAYMVTSVAAAWRGFIGFQSLVVPAWARAPAALFLLVGCGVSLATRSPKPAVLALGAIAVGVAASAVGAYPYGATRHSAWQLAFTVPALGWLGGWIATFPRPKALLLTASAALAFAVALPAGRLLGAEQAALPVIDRVLEREPLTRMVAALDPQAEPDLMIMSAQTFYLLLPFYASERNRAVFAPDSSAFHFPYGAREILTGWSWNLTAGPDPDAPDHLVGMLERADAEFPELGISDRRFAALFVGGWLPPLINELNHLSSAERPIIVSQQFTPGLFAFVLNLRALRAAFDESEDHAIEASEASSPARSPRSASPPRTPPPPSGND